MVVIKEPWASRHYHYRVCRESRRVTASKAAGEEEQVVGVVGRLTIEGLAGRQEGRGGEEGWFFVLGLS